jgi:CheY-like chemotaxis protein
MGTETILLVEDDELVLEHLSDTLKGLGYTIIPCATGREAIDMIQGGARADMLLTDLILAGGLNGQSVADRILALRPGLPVLFMSGYTETSILESRKLEGPVHFIGKPFRRDEIARKLRAALADGLREAALAEGVRR